MNDAAQQRAVFLDRDGTLIEEAEYLSREQDVRFVPRVAEALKKLKAAGFLLFIVTNQSGIGRGYFTVSDMQRVHRFLLGVLAKDGATVDAIYYCPHHPDDNCDCRKPSPKFLQDAAKQFRISLPNSFMIGDKMIDVETGHRAGARGILVRTGYGKEEAKKSDDQPDFVADDLVAAVEWILSQRK